MKGEALITIKTKDGKIKQQVKTKNTVFDIPKEVLKKWLTDIDLGTLGTSSSIPYDSTSGGVISGILDFKDWFGSIKINDETCDLTDFKDWKLPVLWGGEVANQQTSRTRYAYIDTSNSSESNSVIKKVYTWNNCPAFTIKSINLGHKRIQGYNYSSQTFNRSDVSTSLNGQNSLNIVKSGKFYFRKTPMGYSSYEGNSMYFETYQGALHEKSSLFYWNKGYGRKTLSRTLQVGEKGSGSSNAYNSQAIYPLKDNEIALLRRDDDLTTDASTNNNYGNYSQNVKYLYIIDATTGNFKRKFPLTQFDGFTGDSSYHHQSASYMYIMATSFGSFVIMSKTNSSQNLFVWKIPEQSEMSNYSNNETIPVYADLSSTGITTYNGNNCNLIVNNYFMEVGNTYANDKTIRINDDPTNPYTFFNYIPFNNATGTSSNYTYHAFYNKYYDIACDSLEMWYNATALNLSEGVEVAQGDTVTIEYTVTAN